MENNNSKIVKEKIKELGLKYGIINNDIEILTQKALKSVLSQIEFGGDLFIEISKKLYVVEISICNNEVDITVYKATDYFNKYGNLNEVYDNGDISESQYNKYKNCL